MNEIVTCRDAAGCWYVLIYPGFGPPIRNSQKYATAEEADALHAWLDERAAGYPQLKKYEGGKLWPTNSMYGPGNFYELWRAPGHMPPPGLVEPNDVSNL